MVFKGLQNFKTKRRISKLVSASNTMLKGLLVPISSPAPHGISLQNAINLKVRPYQQILCSILHSIVYDIVHDIL
jgi:hypothetical protein